MTILCPIDFSAATPEAVSYAAMLASSTQAELRLLHVLEAGRPSQFSDAWIGTQLASFRVMAEEVGARTSTAIRCGAPAATILAEARGIAAGLLVIGSHGHSQLVRFLVGSTAEEVLRKAPCVTLLIKCNPAEPYRKSA